MTVQSGVITIDQCDLNYCPTVLPCFKSLRDTVESLPPDQQEKLHENVTLPDKHGNVMRLIYELVQVGVLDITSDQYDVLKAVYDRHQSLIDVLKNRKSTKQEKKQAIATLKEDIARFREIIASLPVHSHLFVRQLGDLFADRGMQDFFTFLVFDHLKKGRSRKRIFFSNHDEIMLRQQAAGLFSQLVGNKNATLGKVLGDDARPQDTSLINLGMLIQHDLVSLEEVMGYIDNNYSPDLCLLDYERIDETHVDIFAHSPIDFMAIKRIAGVLGVPHRDETIDALCATIDEINAVFKKAVAEKRVSALLLSQGPEERAMPESLANQVEGRLHGSLYGAQGNIIFNKYPIFSAIWSRPTTVVEGGGTEALLTREKLCSPKREYTTSFYYGHVGEQHVVREEKTKEPAKQYRNLETDLGKLPDKQQGLLKIRYCGSYPQMKEQLGQTVSAADIERRDLLRQKITLSEAVVPEEECCCMPLCRFFGSFFSSKKKAEIPVQSSEPLYQPPSPPALH